MLLGFDFFNKSDILIFMNLSDNSTSLILIDHKIWHLCPVVKASNVASLTDNNFKFNSDVIRESK